jgi:hypothetical protein
VLWLFEMNDGRGQKDGVADSSLVDESLIEAMLALSPIERLRQNDRMVRMVLLLRQGGELAEATRDGAKH